MNSSNGHITERSTESLETELRQLSEQLEMGKQRFDDIHKTLKERRAAGTEPFIPPADKPEPAKPGDLLQVLTLKVTAMEAEQARFVFEAELAKAAQRDAEEKLALVVKHIAAKPRAPLNLDAARELATRHMRLASPDPEVGEPDDWVVNAIIEASK